MLKNAARWALMKPSAYLVNCARGGLINEGDVAAAFQRGQLTGYGADVVEQEPVVPTNPLLTAPNVVLTPHVGIAHLRERRAPGDHGCGEHAPRPARPAPACAGQYPGAADQPSEEACAVPLTKRIME